MFIQVVQGKCSRREELKELGRSWSDVRGEPAGWLGTTMGFTDADDFFVVARFESAEAARANSDSAEQTAFAGKMAALVDGPVEFHDCDEVVVLLDGGSDDAGFVQVIRGHVDDREMLRRVMGDSEALREMRPDIIGGTFALEPDGTFTETIAFTDEASAREGEKVEPPEDVRRALETMLAGATFYDLRDVSFHSPS